VVLTRSSDESIPPRRRAEIANEARADLFLSIHVNWLPDRTARGLETYYLGPTDDPFLRQLASLENRDSGFALADYRELLEGIYADVRRDQSRLLAAGIQQTLFETLRDDNPDIVDRGVMTAPFAVLVTTEMPAVLVEVACLSNDREARLLSLPRYRQRIAEALFSAIVEYASNVASHDVDVEKGTDDDHGT
jgi:N-acetylmuramoyl-L-alanine amidase